MANQDANGKFQQQMTGDSASVYDVSTGFSGATSDMRRMGIPYSACCVRVRMMDERRGTGA